tara:strand:- start:832 stop:2580 length:1749 start_codon:yes stop_codon:yes gene_type:complete
MTIRFLLPKRISKKTGLATLVIRIYDGRDYQKKIWTKLGINSEYWDSKKETIKKGHLNYEDTLAILNKWKTKASYAEKKYTLDRFTRQQVVDHILGKSDFDSILTFIDTVIKETKSNQAYLDYREKYKSFQKVVKPSAELTFDDFLKGSYNLFEKFYLHGKNKVQKEYKWTPITYTSRIEAIGRILSYAKQKKVLHEQIDVPKDFKRIKGQKKQVKAPQSQDVFENIGKIKTVEQWLTYSLWVLEFCLRGMYPADLVQLSEEQLVDSNWKKKKRSIEAIYKNEVWLQKPRSKSQNLMTIRLDVNTTLYLLQVIKNVVAYIYFPNKPNQVADVNDRVALFNYDPREEKAIHQSIWACRQRTLREKFNTNYKQARKALSTVLAKFERENKISYNMTLFMRGRELVDAVDQDSYIAENNPELMKQTDEAHAMVLRDFGIDKIIPMLIRKLKKIIDNPRTNHPQWLLKQSGVHKVGKRYKVMVGFKNKKPVWEAIAPEYKAYFRKDNSLKKGYWTDNDDWIDVMDEQERKERVKEKLFGAKGIGVNPSMTIEDDKENFVKTPEQSPYVKEMKVKEKREKEVVLRAI